MIVRQLREENPTAAKFHDDRAELESAMELAPIATETVVALDEIRTVHVLGDLFDLSSNIHQMMANL